MMAATAACRWVREQGFEHTSSPENIGICLAVNEAAMHAKMDYIVYLNDDMYCCPGWDTALTAKLKGIRYRFVHAVRHDDRAA